MVIAAMKLKDAYSLEEKLWQIAYWKAEIALCQQKSSSQGYRFSSGHVWMWELDCKESCVPKKWCFWTVVLEKTLESHLDRKEIQPVHPTGDQSWVFIGRTDVEAETPIFWPTHAKNWPIGKDPDAGEDDRGWDCWMASPTQWTWVWVDSGSWWWTGRPGVLRFMGSQGVRHDWATELNWRFAAKMRCLWSSHLPAPSFPNY